MVGLHSQGPSPYRAWLYQQKRGRQVGVVWSISKVVSWIR